MSPRVLGAAACAALALSLSPHPAGAAATPCDPGRLEAIPARPASAAEGSAFAREVAALSGPARDAVIRDAVLAGDIPQFLRRLVPVSIVGEDADGRVELTLCVLPDYLAVGSDRDFVFVPMGLQAALDIARRFGFELPTRPLVDAIYASAVVRLEPQPLPADDAMRSTATVVLHNALIAMQRAARSAPLGVLTSGHKKDLVLTSRLWMLPGRVAIYGWHRASGAPIQPLSTVHGARYADYSHGVRLVSDVAYVNGSPRPLTDIYAEPRLARLLTAEAPWTQFRAHLAALRDHLAAERSGG